MAPRRVVTGATRSARQDTLDTCYIKRHCTSLPASVDSVRGSQGATGAGSRTRFPREGSPGAMGVLMTATRCSTPQRKQRDAVRAHPSPSARPPTRPALGPPLAPV